MTNANDFILTMSNISKIFPGVNALENVDFFMKRGEIHALLGGNGAGKSTLIKGLTGIEYPEASTIELNGEVVQVRSSQHPQEVNQCANKSITENIMFGHEPHRIVALQDRKKAAEYSGDVNDQTIIQTMAGDL